MRLALALIAAAALAACMPGERYDVVIRNGWIIDGTGNPRFLGDVAVKNGRVAAVGRLGEVRARHTIDAAGLVVSPGFIDMLGWSDLKVLADGRAASKVTQGITTEVTGEGASVAPQTDATIAEDAEYHASLGITVDWRDLEGYFRRLEESGSTINVASFVGATQVRMAVLGNDDREPTAEELQHMVALVDSAMMQGALGVSTSLVYAPAFYASTDELIALAHAASGHGGVYAGSPNWGDMQRVLARLDSARAAGIDVTANLYPYVASATSLDASIPQWAHEGGDSVMIERLMDPAERARIRADMLTPAGDAESFYRGAGGAAGVMVAGVLADSLRYLEGRTLAHIAAEWGVDPVDALFDIVVRDNGNTGAIYFSMTESDVRDAVSHWWTSFCTDFGAVATDGILSEDRVHPRVYGSFPRILGRYVRQYGLLSLESAIRKMTSLPAQRVGLTDRGILRPGMAADVVVFDPNTIIDRATFEEPHQYSEGIRYVLVNGELVLDDGRITDRRPGRGLRGPGWRGK
jgi:dihydroorotase/N-acyl-D-amino-acid deacylase